MPRFANMLVNGMRQRGHSVKIWTPSAKFFLLPFPDFLKKWLGYIDQYILFPREVKKRLKNISNDTLFIFTDHALGPWVPLVRNLHHVIHCHDFLAQRSALGLIPENPTSRTGRIYQKFIRRGYSTGKNFISVSYKTKEDLNRFLSKQPVVSEVVYNGLNQTFTHKDRSIARDLLGNKTKMNLAGGYILHVGGNAWYKNRAGVIEIYESWRSGAGKEIPLLLIGEAPTKELLTKHSQSRFQVNIHWLVGTEDEFVQMAYAGASAFLFPSLAEGFGWPIAEAMAAGCPVITTNEAPMTEVAGDAGFFIKRRPNNELEVKKWAEESAFVVNQILDLTRDELSAVTQAGILNALRFDTDVALDHIELIYQKIIERGD